MSTNDKQEDFRKSIAAVVGSDPQMQFLVDILGKDKAKELITKQVSGNLRKIALEQAIVIHRYKVQTSGDTVYDTTNKLVALLFST